MRQTAQHVKRARGRTDGGNSIGGNDGDDGRGDRTADLGVDGMATQDASAVMLPAHVRRVARRGRCRCRYRCRGRRGHSGRG